MLKFSTLEIGNRNILKFWFEQICQPHWVKKFCSVVLCVRTLDLTFSKFEVKVHVNESNKSHAMFGFGLRMRRTEKTKFIWKHKTTQSREEKLNIFLVDWNWIPYKKWRIVLSISYSITESEDEDADKDGVSVVSRDEVDKGYTQDGIDVERWEKDAKKPAMRFWLKWNRPIF